VGLLARVRDYIDALVHPSAQQDAPGSRHRVAAARLPRRATDAPADIVVKKSA
jgi:hypothetical protein